MLLAGQALLLPLLLPGLVGCASPGSLALSGMRSQLLPPSVVCSRMAGLPTIQPSSPAKLMDWNLRAWRHCRGSREEVREQLCKCHVQLGSSISQNCPSS
jgi:hypothetical protein